MLVNAKLDSEFKQVANLKQSLCKYRTTLCNHLTLSPASPNRSGRKDLLLVKGKSPTARNLWKTQVQGSLLDIPTPLALQNRADLPCVSISPTNGLIPLYSNFGLWICSWGLFLCFALTVTKSLDKCAKEHNPCGIVGSNHWNCVYCCLHTGKYNFSDFCIFRLC